MTHSKKQTFLQGALILVAANLLVKVIGAVFKIPLARLIDEEGMGLFGVAYNIYTFMFVVATAGFPTAVSKMVSESLALGREKEADRVFSVAVIVLGIIGVVGSVALFKGADFFAKAMGSEHANYGIVAISPAVLCVSLVSAIRGYFQGRQNMYPTAFSEVIEATGKLAIGYGLAYMLMPKGIDLAAAGAVFGVTCGAFLALVFMVLVYMFKRNRNRSYDSASSMSRRQVAKRLLLIAVPITVGASVASLTNLLDMVTVLNRLQAITETTSEFVSKYASLIDFSTFDGSVSESLATKLYGMYTGYAVPLFNMPLTIVTALSMSVVPAVSGALAKRDEKTAQLTTLSALRITVLFSVPCAFGLSVLAEPVLVLLYGTGLAASALQELAFAIIFVSLLSVTSAVLQSYGKVNIPVINMIVGGIVKLIVNYTLVAMPSVNIEGAPIGTLCCYFVIVLLNMFFIVRCTKIRLSVLDFIVKPLFSGGIMAAVVYLFYQWLVGRQVNMAYASVPAIVVGAVVYCLMIFLVGAIKEEDVRMLPKGDKLVSILQKAHLLKKRRDG